ncbi:MAG TPA: hypothetical protein DCM07_07890 [Planctomycetaceae bacterium]|nr:hypothetical protein [Planctomycetaceae bacterium]
MNDLENRGSLTAVGLGKKSHFSLLFCVPAQIFRPAKVEDADQKGYCYPLPCGLYALPLSAYFRRWGRIPSMN